MKLRATREVFYSALTEEDLKGHILNDMESPEYPQIISNNECSAVVNSENATSDSALSFLIKFKASNVAPSAIPNGVCGIEFPEAGLPNTHVNDNQSHFNSINVNHHDLRLESETELNKLVAEIRELVPHYHSFDLDGVKRYVLRTLDDPEWVAFYQNDKKWRKFKNKIIQDSFEKKHCPIVEEDLKEYMKAPSDEMEKDLVFLKQHDAVTDAKKLKLLTRYFSKMLWPPID